MTIIENTSPPKEWCKTKWLRPEESLRPEWEFIGQEFAQVCCLKARIKKISFLNSFNQGRWANGVFDDLLPYVMNSAYVEVQWNTDAYVPEELLASGANIITKCVYDCGFFHTARRVFDSNQRIVEPLIYGLQNISWFAFTDEKRLIDPDSFAPLSGNTYSDEDYQNYLNTFPLQFIDVSADIVFVLYDPVAKDSDGFSIPLQDRLILLGHSQYDGIDGKDNNKDIFRSKGLSLSGIVDVLTEDDLTYIVYRNKYLRIVKISNNCPEEYRTGLQGAYTTLNRIWTNYYNDMLSFYPYGIDRHEYRLRWFFDSKFIYKDLYKNLVFRISCNFLTHAVLTDEPASGAKYVLYYYRLMIFIDNSPIAIRRSIQGRQDVVWTGSMTQRSGRNATLDGSNYPKSYPEEDATDAKYANLISSNDAVPNIFAGNLQVMGITTIELLNQNEFKISTICADSITTDIMKEEPDGSGGTQVLFDYADISADIYRFDIIVNKQDLSNNHKSFNAVSITKQLLTNGNSRRVTNRSHTAGTYSTLTEARQILSMYKNNVLSYEGEEDYVVIDIPESSGDTTTHFNSSYNGSLIYNGITLYTDDYDFSATITTPSGMGHGFSGNPGALDWVTFGYIDGASYEGTINVLLSAYMEEEIFHWLEVVFTDSARPTIKRKIYINGITQEIETFTDDDIIYVDMPHVGGTGISYNYNFFVALIPWGEGRPAWDKIDRVAGGWRNIKSHGRVFRHYHRLTYTKQFEKEYINSGTYFAYNIEALLYFQPAISGAEDFAQRNKYSMMRSQGGYIHTAVNVPCEVIKVSDNNRIILLRTRRLNNPAVPRLFLFFDGTLIDDDFNFAEDWYNQIL